MAELTQARVRALFNYDEETGLLFWREREREDFATERAWKYFNTRFAGNVAGAIVHRRSGPYRVVCIDNVKYWQHRVVWLYAHGAWPRQYIDHKNLDGADNRLSNLREASHTQNLANCPKREGTLMEFKGVARVRQSGRYAARIRANGKLIHLGCFDTPEEAHAAYCRAASTHFGEFARPG